MHLLGGEELEPALDVASVEARREAVLAELPQSPLRLVSRLGSQDLVEAVPQGRRHPVRPLVLQPPLRQ